MSKKSKGVVVSDSKPPYGVGVYDDAKTRFKHQTLMQDYQELQQEAIVMKRKLDEAKQRKLTLVAEVRFLRRRYKFLAKRKTLNLSEDLKHVHPPNPLKRTKIMKAQNFSRKEANLHRLPPIPELQQPKKKHYIQKEVALRSVSPVIDQNHNAVLHAGKQATRHNLIPVSDINHKGRINIRKETLALNTTPVLDLNLKERTQGANDPALRNSMAAFDLNQDSNLNGREASLPNRSQIFDLNEISTGDEEFQINGEAVKFEEAKKNLIRGLNDDQQNELKLSICRNAGEGTSRVRKRKISWQDPVALRV